MIIIIIIQNSHFIYMVFQLLVINLSNILIFLGFFNITLFIISNNTFMFFHELFLLLKYFYSFLIKNILIIIVLILIEIIIMIKMLIVIFLYDFLEFKNINT